ncbi:hypothetical protein [Thermococcus sp.]
MRHLRAIVLVLVLMVAFIGGCLSTTGPAQSTSNSSEGTSSTSQTSGGGAESETFTTTVVEGIINGTFSGLLTAPQNVFNEARTLLEKTNATLYSFKVNVVGKNLNASITLYALKLVPPFVPRDFNLTINARPLNGTVFVAYADRIPITIEAGNGLTTTSQLTVKPEQVFDVEGVWDAQRLNELNGSVILRNKCLELKVFVRKPGDYVFKIFHNGTEISSGGLEVDS